MTTRLPIVERGPSLDEVDGSLVVFRHRGGRGLALFGEVVDWRTGLAMQPRGDHAELALRLRPGIYAYKFRTPAGDWQLDADNPRTRSVDGQRNSVLVVGGSAEPLLHAPASPTLWLGEDGRVCVRAGLRRGWAGAGAGDARLTLRWDEGEGPRDVAMRVVAEEDEHRIFEAWLPTSARFFDYVFVLADGRVRGQAGAPGVGFRVDRRRLRAPAPSWWREAVVYTLLVDRFRAGGRGGTWPARIVEAVDAAELRAGQAPRHIPFGRVDVDEQRRMAWEQGRAGGDLEGVIEGLDHLEALGVTVLHLTPIFEARSAHRYDVVDMLRVDPALGGEAALRRLLDAAHARGMRVLLDVTVSHVHRDFFAFADVRARGRDSPYWDWFHIQRYPFDEGLDPGYLSYAKGAWQEPALRCEHPGVVDYLVGVFEHWARFGVDGFRVDAAADVPLGLLRRVREAVARIAPQAVVFGEVVPDNLQRWTAAALDAATDFPAQQALYAWLLPRGGEGKGGEGKGGEPEGAGRAASLLARRRASRDSLGAGSLAFTATHDQPRLRTLVGRAPALLGQLLVLLRASVPALLYGDELGMHSDEPERGFEDVWPDRGELSWDPERWDAEALALHREALALRRQSAALREGDEQFFTLEGGEDRVLGLRRTSGAEIFELLLNASDEPRSVALREDAPSDAVLRLRHGEVELAPEAGRVTLGPWAAALLERRPSAAVLAVLDALRTTNAARAEASFRAGELTTLALPRRLYLTVTEACNLRCDHCITHAPIKTREGRARTMQPWLHEALEDAFATAEYFGFTHGGESLVSKQFIPLLRAIARARGPGAQPFDAHLLSNGMRLDLATVETIHGLGINSLAVSLDGASAASNDGLRRGAKLDEILAKLRAIVAWRERTGADLRLGISMVAGIETVAELPAMGRLARELGVDWLKIEEFYPATPRAKREFLEPRDPRFAAGMDALRAELAGSSLVLVDHRAVPAGCWCRAEPGTALREFLEADAFANRARFYACRMAYEQACVEPDGRVHAVAYEAPALGSLAEASLLELWNGPQAQHARRAGLAWARSQCGLAIP
ncbi:radical SAM protein [Pseudenhygromyxa sp. WMMC2535]|uniref:alpha-amylase family glycosyl hydrolase n=1 Tax=Pseudenhygromyxa sp. WMMC2535 TaxID=2712867 RepID=UPI0015542578|nr:alpha-amylase family glycosyl hydrolase [Pseudenhygromyxa sp. WMMC2535]NVB36847.1 radical SAM protein [Pseudenhygromyxa sp. WMMC2535]